MTSTKFFLLLTGASAIFVYFVSPTRDPKFGKFSAPDGGSPHWWLKGVHEDHWVLAAFILAGLLAITLTLNLTLKLWHWYGSQTGLTVDQRREAIPLRLLIIGVMNLGIAIGIWRILYHVFFIYLLEQWLID
jgi:hypothetical protein